MSAPPQPRRWSRLNGESLRRVLTLGLVAGLTVLGLESTGTLAAWTDSVPLSGTSISTGSLAAPTSLSVTQECRADPTPVRRPGAGGFSTTVNAGATNNAITIAKPSAAVTGDVLLAAITWSGNHQVTQTPDLTAPPGWTLVRRDGDNALGQFVYTRVVVPSEPASYTWTGLTSNKAGAIVAFSGVDTVVPVNASSGRADQVSGIATAPSVTTTRANVVVVGAFGLLNTQTQPAPTGMTGVWAGFTSTGTNPEISIMGAEQSYPTPGATGDKTSSAPGARTVGQLVALQPPAFPFATTTWTRSSSSWATGQEFRRSAGGTVQRQASLDATTTTQTDGPLVPATSYTVDVTATFQNWRSPTAPASFVARGCWPP